jgi:hypothetical protein
VVVVVQLVVAVLVELKVVIDFRLVTVYEYCDEIQKAKGGPSLHEV